MSDGNAESFPFYPLPDVIGHDALVDGSRVWIPCQGLPSGNPPKNHAFVEQLVVPVTLDSGEMVHHFDDTGAVVSWEALQQISGAQVYDSHTICPTCLDTQLKELSG